MKVIVSKNSGYCAGVKRAIQILDDSILKYSSGSPVFTMGDIIHNPKVIENYKKYKLDKLIIENSSQRLKCESNPFLFLLLLSDTIEPIKFFTQYQSKCVLNKIDIEVLSGLKKISITTNDLCMDCHNWFDKIKDMENWLDLTVKDIDNGLTIEIK